MYVSLRNLLRLCYCSGIVAAVSVANAQVSSVGPVATRSGNSFSVAYPTGGASVAAGTRTVAAGSSAGTYTVTDALSVAVPAGFLPVAVTRGVTGAAVATALAEAGAAATGIGLAALGVGAYQLFQNYRIRSAASGGGFEWDPGVDPSPQMTWKASFPANSPTASSAAGSIQAAHLSRASSTFIPLECLPDTLSYSYSGTSASMRCNFRTAVAPNGYIDSFSYGTSSTSVLGCQPQIDALNGQTYSPAIGADGKCMTGRYEAKTTASVASTLQSGMTVDAVKDYILSGTSAARPVAQSTPTTITGPASQVGASTTSVTNSGNVTTTTTNTPTYNYTYGGTTVNYTVTNGGTATTTNTGTGTTTTETTTKPETTIPGLCDLFPAISACAKLDMPDAPDPLPTVPYAPSITPHVFGSSATCPAPITLSFPRLSFTMSWQPLCDLATAFLSPIVGFLSLFAAVKVFFSGFRV